MSDSLATIFNKLAATVESYINNTVGASDPCTVCPDAFGCINLDLSDCNNFEVLVKEDITCIRIVGEGAPGRIDFIIPPNTTRSICGFPASWGAEGNECDITLSGGDKGSTFSVPHNGSAGGGSGGGAGEGKPTIPNVGTDQGGGGGGDDCICIAEDGLLKVTCCSASCKIDCSKATPTLEFRACGGKLPYAWATTAGTILVTGVTQHAQLKPPVNTGSGVAGNAYVVTEFIQGTPNKSQTIYGCDDLVESGPTTSTCQFGCGDGSCLCPGFCCGTDGCGNSLGCDASCPDTSCPCRGDIITCDARTQVMIDAGCAPCKAALLSAVITVTDALGVSVSTTVGT